MIFAASTGLSILISSSWNPSLDKDFRIFIVIWKMDLKEKFQIKIFIK